MNKDKVSNILHKLASGRITQAAAYETLKDLPFEDIEFAKIDHHRTIRTGIPEVIFGPGKTDNQIIKIIGSMKKSGSPIIISRVSKKSYNIIKRHFPAAKYNEQARMILLSAKKKTLKSPKYVAVLSAGTSDINVAEEAAATIEAFGGKAERIYDVGVAGIHRLFSFHKKISKASVVIVAAGMEGALPSVVAGMISAPIIAVPTSVGYGASFGGIAALLAMLNSCAPGITVVNIDNGFGAAMAALKMLRI